MLTCARDWIKKCAMDSLSILDLGALHGIPWLVLCR